MARKSNFLVELLLVKLSYPSGRNWGRGASSGLMHNDYAVSVTRMLRLNLYARERERTMYAEAA